MKLKLYLKENNLSQHQFAKDVQLSEATISRILNNHGYNPGIAAIVKIVERTKGDVDYLDFV